MDKIDKFIRKLSKPQRTQVVFIIERIHGGDISGLDVRKLQGRENEFRVRKGEIRVIFKRIDNSFYITDIQWRGSKTY